MKAIKMMKFGKVITRESVPSDLIKNVEIAIPREWSKINLESLMTIVKEDLRNKIEEGVDNNLDQYVSFNVMFPKNFGADGMETIMNFVLLLVGKSVITDVEKVEGAVFPPDRLSELFPHFTFMTLARLMKYYTTVPGLTITASVEGKRKPFFEL